MSLLSVSELSFEYSGGALLFEQVSFCINPADRIAIVGPNGCGKSTLLRLLAGQMDPTRGTIVFRRGLTIAVAGQDGRASSQTLIDFVLGAVPGLSDLRDRIRALEHAPDLASANEYADRINEYEECGGFQAEAEAERILCGVGFAPLDFDRVMQSLSGGERARAELARALSREADFLILDEPTNHLDVSARDWLEANLKMRKGACVITSHDRVLLSAFAGRLVEIDRAAVRVFEGGYEAYRRARALLDREAWAAYQAFERRKAAVALAARRRDALASRVAGAPMGVPGGNDHYARKAAKVARTARILRERVDEEHSVEKPWEQQPINGLTFERVARSGDTVLVAEKLTKSYGPKTLFRDLNFQIRRGERWAITGANGSGKTTLLNVIHGTISPERGSVRLGAKVEMAMLSQNLDGMDSERSPLEICGSDFGARTLLACLRVRPDCLNRPLRELSGGERTKVALARILNSGANLLLLDEPTNHLEIEAQEALEQALRLYPGALIAVSHDRFFLESLGPEAAFLELSGTISSGKGM